MNRNGIIHLAFLGVLQYFLFWGFCPLWFLSFCSFVLWCFCPFWIFSIRPRDRMTRMLIVHTCIMLSYEQKLNCTNWLFEYMYLNILSFGGFVPFDFYPLSLLSCSALSIFGFSLFANGIAWRQCWLSTPVSCDHMNRNRVVYLDCWSIKMFSLLGFCSLSFWSFGPLSYGAFVRFGLFLSAHVIALRECWLSTPVPCDHMNRNWIVQIDCLSACI